MNQFDKDLPPNFDWVKARTDCSVVVMFDELRHQVHANIDRRNETTNNDGDKQFRFVDRTAERIVPTFAVLDTWDIAQQRAVHFERSGHRISIQMLDKTTLEATLTLTDKGICRFKIFGEELDAWQVCRRVLEPLLFPPS